MAYVAVTGGSEAIEQSLKLLEIFRNSGEDLSVRCIQENMGLLIEQIMSEAGFILENTPPWPIKQGEGSVEEAGFSLACVSLHTATKLLFQRGGNRRYAFDSSYFCCL